MKTLFPRARSFRPIRRPRRVLGILASLLLLSGAPALALAQARPSPDAEMILRHGEPALGTYVSNHRGFETSSYWIEGPDGLVLIDTQFLLSAGEEAVNWAEKATGKRVVLALVLHPNPDKFNGTETLKRRGIPVLTSDQVRALIPDVHKDRHHWFYERFKPDYPDEAPMPDSFGDKTKDLTAGGVTLTAHVLGAGCSGAHVVVTWKDHLFTGDLVTNQNHSWLELGRTDEWLDRIAELKAMKAKYIHPGRGASGGPELLDREEAYLRKVIELVAAEHPGRAPKGKERKLSPEARKEAALARVQAKMDELYSGYGYEHFLEIGLPAEWDRQAKATARP